MKLTKKIVCDKPRTPRKYMCYVYIKNQPANVNCLYRILWENRNPNIITN